MSTSIFGLLHRYAGSTAGENLEMVQTAFKVKITYSLVLVFLRKSQIQAIKLAKKLYRWQEWEIKIADCILCMSRKPFWLDSRQMFGDIVFIIFIYRTTICCPF